MKKLIGLEIKKSLINDEEIKEKKSLQQVKIKKILKNNGDFYEFQLVKSFGKNEIEFNAQGFYGGLLKTGLILNISGKFNEFLFNKGIKEFYIDSLNIDKDSFKNIQNLIKDLNNSNKSNKNSNNNKLLEVFKQMNTLEVVQTKLQIDEKILYKIYAIYKGEILNKLNENPYLLIKYGLDFKQCDKVAKNLGVFDNLSENRIFGGIKFMFKMINEQGSSYILEKDFNLYINKVLKIEKDNQFFGTYIDFLRKKGEIFIKNGKISSKETYLIEKYIINSIYDIKKQVPIKIKDEFIFEEIKNFEEKKSIKLTKDQIDSIIGSLSKNISIITGGPGTGKSTIQEVIYKILNQIYDNDEIVFLTPTGVAGKNLSNIVGKEVKTIHSFLGYNPFQKFKTGEICKYNEKNKLENIKVIIIDEMSMVSNLLFNYLLKGINFDEIKFIFVGDINQLNSVEYGQILNDLIKIRIPIFYLDKGFRFNNSIKENANLILNYKVGDEIKLIQDKNFIIRNIESSSNLEEKIILEKDKITKENLKFSLMEEYNDKYNILIKKIFSYYINDLNYNIKDIKVLSPFNGKFYGVNNNNKIIIENFSHNSESLEIYGTKFSVGDLIINTLNDKERQVFNGDIGEIKEIFVEKRRGKNINCMKILFNGDKEEKIICGSFLKNIKHSYSISIHKSQGSGFKIVIIPVFEDFEGGSLLNKRLIYTGITRAKESVILIKNNYLDIKSILNNEDMRNTMLDEIFE